jgi:hypothetical protein
MQSGLDESMEGGGWVEVQSRDVELGIEIACRKLGRRIPKNVDFKGSGYDVRYVEWSSGCYKVEWRGRKKQLRL